jgi:hypothetical protein
MCIYINTLPRFILFFINARVFKLEIGIRHEKEKSKESVNVGKKKRVKLKFQNFEYNI